MENSDTFIEVVNIKLVSEKKIYSDKSVRTPEDAVKVLGAELCKYNRECFAIVNLQTDMRIINFNICSIGSIDAAIVSTAEIFKCALLSNAAQIMVMHNHPSGNTKPSKEDISVTKKIAEACRLMNIGFIDHIIVGEMGNYYSFRENNQIDSSNHNVDRSGEINKFYNENKYRRNGKEARR